MSKTYKNIVKNRFTQKKQNWYKKQKRKFIEVTEDELQDENGEVREVQKENETRETE